ncbi:MAG: alpha/beta fold hydrolase [Pseudomonadota bacterium]
MGDGFPFAEATPIVVALHGSASHPAQWSTLARLAGDRFRVLPEVLPGYHGRRPAMSGARGLGCRALPLIAGIEEHGAPVHLVGHSFGGSVALKIATMRPDLVASLTIYEPVLPQIFREGRTPDERRAVGKLMSVSTRLAAAVATGHADEGVAGFIDLWNGFAAWRTLSLARR